jgi:hypothetical protein
VAALSLCWLVDDLAVRAPLRLLLGVVIVPSSILIVDLIARFARQNMCTYIHKYYIYNIYIYMYCLRVWYMKDGLLICFFFSFLFFSFLFSLSLSFFFFSSSCMIARLLLRFTPLN